MFTQSIKYNTFYHHVLRVQMFEKFDPLNRSKNEWLFLSASFTAKFELVFVLTLGNVFSKRFDFKANRKNMIFLKSNTRNFQKNPSIWEIGMFLYDNQWKFWTFSILQLWNRFSGKRKPFSKNWSTNFYLKALRLITYHFHTKLLYQKPMLRQIEW